MKKLIIAVFAVCAIISCKNEKKVNVETTSTPTSTTTTNVVKSTPTKDFKTENLPSAKTVVNNYFKAIGGVDKVKTVKTLVTNAETNVGGQSMKIVSKYAQPNKFTTTFTAEDGKSQRQFFDGKNAFMQADDQKMQMPPSETDIFKKETTPFADMAYLDGEVTGIEDVNGEKTYVVKTGDKQVFYSVKTGLKVKDIMTFEDYQTGKMLSLPTLYSNYKTVNGIKFPHTVEQDMGEGALMKMNFKSFGINKNVTDKDFK